ncbi:DUF5624 domain-containing protein [Microbaculum sp. FT89]|uniref:DUF5624 domain-containing protein n=1 Tax=Microbaculum sp. FT89 TaxID=3447298 RepID=UPI003F52AA3F
MPITQSPEFVQLFKTYTADSDSIGSHLTQAAEIGTIPGELLVISGTDIAVFSGDDRPPVVESFRLSTRGFVEMAAISHLGPSVAALVRMRELDPESTTWRADARRLADQLRVVKGANTLALWRDTLAVDAWAGFETKIVDLVDYACTVTSDYLQSALADQSPFTFDHLRDHYLEATAAGAPPVPFNHVMIATFCLTALDISARMIRWLRAQALHWEQLKVLIVGQSGRPTAGLTWSSNNMCHLLSRASEGRLPSERLYIVPHAPDLAPASDGGDDPWHDVEQHYRTVWYNTYANVRLASRMFETYPRYAFTPRAGVAVNRATESVSELPPVTSPSDMFAFVSRLRFVLEDPRQLISNCVADYVIDRLCEHDCRPELVEIPGLSNVAYPGKHEPGG